MPATVQAFDHHHHSSHHGSSSGGGCGSSSSASSSASPSATPSPASASHKLVFVTSTQYSGALGSVKAADGYCQQSAAAAGISGVFHAWISDGTTNAYDRTGDVGPWYTTSGELAFSQKAELRTGSPATDLLDEHGGPPADAAAWTGTDPTGVASGHDCEAWTNATSNATATTGSALALDPTWGGDDTASPCDGKAPLICFQQ
ncbi:MAG TPA: hypothetical protein VLT33_37670 [Labilithrix sp.]|nr:hypothetical protein [Labilithrix sp.]